MALYTIADLHLACAVNKPMDIFGGWKNYMRFAAKSTVKSEKVKITSFFTLFRIFSEKPLDKARNL